MMSRVALVTGAAGGIGVAIAERLVRDGYAVHCLDLREEAARAAARRIGAASGLGVDVSSGTGVRGAVDAVLERSGRIDAVVNLAGVHRPAPVLEASEDDLDLVYRINVKGTFLVSQIAAKAMADRGEGGAIVNFASIAAEHATPQSTVYATSKGAVISMTRAMAVGLAADGIRVNAIAPGPVETEMNAARREDPEYMARMVARVPLGRQGQPEDIAGAVSFLCGDDAAWLTGEIIRVDGGISVLR